MHEAGHLGGVRSLIRPGSSAGVPQATGWGPISADRPGSHFSPYARCEAGVSIAGRSACVQAGTTPRLTPQGKVTIIPVMSETRSLADVKAHFSEIVDLVEKQHERVIVTRHGRPAAVILSPGDLEGLEETLEILATPGALEEIHAAERDLEHSDYLTAAELRAKYLSGG